MSEMHQSLKPIFVSLQLLGFFSLKSNCKESYGRWYYLWSILLLTLTWVNVLRNGFVVKWKIHHVIMLLISSFMMANVLWNEHKLIEILENIERLDLKIGKLKRGKGGCAIAWAAWLTYLGFKIYEGISIGIPSDILIATTLVTLPNVMVFLLWSSLYEELVLRCSALSQLLSARVRLDYSQDLCLALQSARLLYFNIQQQVCSLNTYLGFTLLCSIFSGQVHIFTKFLSVLDRYYQVTLQLAPDELLLVFHLSSIADSLKSQSSKICTTMKSLPLYQMDTKTKLQVELFVQGLEACPLTVTANGFFTVDKTLCLSLTVTSAVYFTTFYLMKNEISTLSVALAAWIQEWLPFSI